MNDKKDTYWTSPFFAIDLRVKPEDDREIKPYNDRESGMEIAVFNIQIRVAKETALLKI